MTYNIAKLTEELVAACPRVVGCAADGRVDFADGSSWRPGDPTPDADRVTVAAVVAAHDPTDTPDQKLGKVAVPLRILAALTQIASKGRVNAPAWARTTVDGFAALIDGALA
jgi:hypothetical protein